MLVEGTAFLCFTADDSRFYGILSTSSHSVYTLKGKTTPPPKCHFHECCFDKTPQFYELCINDSTGIEMDGEKTIRHVMRTGGDNCSLTCDETSCHLEFSTDQLLSEKKAEDYIAKYFWPQLLNLDCYVCIGPMSINCDNEAF